MTINLQLAEVALERCEGTAFEKFAQSLIAALTGADFVPVGGMHDGGADGFVDGGLFAGDKPSHFMQASVQRDYTTKVRNTIKRLLASGHDVKQLTYCTSIIIPRSDIVEDDLSDELSVRIKIRDQKYIVSQINYSAATIAAFESYLEPALAFLQRIGGSSVIGPSSELPMRSLCVFLGQEVERRRGNTELLEAVTDTLILWSLEGTDPAKESFLTRSQIESRIITALPSAAQFIRGSLDKRLAILSSKENANGREIRWYKKEGNFCLPFETRELIKVENTEDEILKQSVSEIFRSRATGLLKGNAAALIDKVIEASHRTLEITFERQGLDLAAFFLGEDAADDFVGSIADNTDRALRDIKIPADAIDTVKEATLQILRNTFYKSESVERIYLGKLSRTYTLLFVLKNEPRVVEYFRRMSADFVLYVGSDLLIRSLSEYYLRQEDRMTWNMFTILKAAGASLILTEATLSEVISHLRASDFEYRNHYLEMQPFVNFELARHIDRILVRSYFYARLDPQTINAPAGWADYVGTFCTYRDLHSPLGQESLKRYLQEEFGFDFESEDETYRGIDQEELATLTAKILEFRPLRRHKEAAEILAENDALHVLRVYAKRRELGEQSKPNPFGYRTWWLTQEVVVRKATTEVIARRHAQYMMRPEFALNFIALAPSAEQVRASYEAIFPTLLGVKLSNRLRPETLETVLSEIKKASTMGDARARARASELADKLKGDNFKRYEITLEDSGTD
jgi:hypothetical protein